MGKLKTGRMDQDIDPKTEWSSLNIDSLDFVEVLLELESKYNVKLSEASMSLSSPPPSFRDKCSISY